jgi:hypothetical protein
MRLLHDPGDFEAAQSIALDDEHDGHRRALIALSNIA